METDAGRARAQGPAPSLFQPCLTQPKQYTADVMKSIMYFGPPLHILTSIHLIPPPYLNIHNFAIQPSPYCAIQPSNCITSSYLGQHPPPYLAIYISISKNQIWDAGLILVSQI